MVRRLTAAGLLVVALLGVGLALAHHGFHTLRSTLPVTYTGTGSATIGPFTPAEPWTTATTVKFPGPGGLIVQNELLVRILGTEAVVQPGQASTTYDSGPYRLAVVAPPGATWSVHLLGLSSTVEVPAGRGWWVPLLAVGAGLAMLYACHPVGLRRRPRVAAPPRPAVTRAAAPSTPVSTLLVARPAKPPRRRRHISWARALGDQGPPAPRGDR